MASDKEPTMTDAAAPLGFHHIRLELAREPQHPEGDHDIGYDILAPLKADRRLDAAAWREAPEKCRVRRFSHGATLAFGRLRHAAPDRWFLDFEPGEAEDAHGFRLADEALETGEYVSLSTGDQTHTYVVARAESV
jgi:hypothetical protein